MVRVRRKTDGLITALLTFCALLFGAVAPASAAAPSSPKEVVTAFYTEGFVEKDLAGAANRYIGDTYIQHNPQIPQGRDALRSVVETLSPSVHYEPGLIIAEGDLVAIHGRIRGWSEEPQVVIDIFRVQGGKLAEHWDVLQTEAPAASGTAGLSMFDPDESAHQPRSEVALESGRPAARRT